ncbi:MAG: flagellar basal body L-ring protein FlgH [Planctomycetota bacterium]
MKFIAITILLLSASVSAEAQSLWNPDRPAPAIFSDTTARLVGDILTVVINETQRVANDEQTTFDKSSSLDAVLTNFDLLPNFLEPLPQVTANAEKKFEGSGKVDKDSSFQTRMSVLVIDVMPNGNLLIEGTRTIIVDGDKKIIRLTGVVRAYDIARNNTVRSEFVANASLAFEGTGPLSRSVNRGWFSRLLDTVWPF